MRLCLSASQNVAVFLLCVAFSLSFAEAQTVLTGRKGCLAVQQIVEGSEVGVDAYSAGVCVAMAQGIGTMMTYNCSLAPHALIPKASPPRSVNEVIIEFLDWAEQHPERWGDEFSDGMIAAIMNAFPCQPEQVQEN